MFECYVDKLQEYILSIPYLRLIITVICIIGLIYFIPLIVKQVSEYLSSPCKYGLYYGDFCFNNTKEIFGVLK
jgi:hypothetical protein